MSQQERLLYRLGTLLSQVARPHRCDDGLPDETQAGLWELGFPCGDETPREELIARLWARKRSLLLTLQPEWGGPGVTPPPTAA